MIRCFTIQGTLAKSAPEFRGFPMCKISKFSQDLQGFCDLFLSCEENSDKHRMEKNVISFIISTLTDLRFFANVFVI